MKSQADQSTGGREAARLLRAAGDQIDLALADSQPSVDALGQTLGRLADLLSSFPAADPSAEQLALLRAEMGRAVTCMQFHDRLTQHLSHVRHHMAEGADQLGMATDMPAEPWAGLYQQFAMRLLSDSQRECLTRHFPQDFPGVQRKSSTTDGGSPANGDTELF